MDNNEIEVKPVKEKRVQFITTLIREAYYQGYVDRVKNEGMKFDDSFLKNERMTNIMSKVLPGYFSFVDKYNFTFTGDKEEYTIDAGTIEEARDVLSMLLSEKRETIEEKTADMSIKISPK